MTERARATSAPLCTVDGRFAPIQGSVAAVAEAARRGTDLRRSSQFNLEDTGFVEETGTLQTTWVFDDANVGGLQTMRHPVDGGLGISRQPSLALWIFNVAASQRSAMVPLNGEPMVDATGAWANVDNRPYSREAEHLVPTRYRWWARDDWEEVCAHDADGAPSMGSWEELRTAVNDGCRVKVGVRDVWSYLTPEGEAAPSHEAFMECTSEFSHVDGKFFAGLTQPTFFVQPCTPLQFTGERFAPGWLMVRTDGKALRQSLDPATMQWEQVWMRKAMRWFVR